MNITDNKMKFLKLASEKFGAEGSFKNREMLDFIATQNEFTRAESNWVFSSENKISRGEYRLPRMSGNSTKVVAKTADAEVAAVGVVVPFILPKSKKFDPNANSEFDHAGIPSVDPLYVAFGDFRVVEQIIKSQQFFPIFISGLSGNGKTFMVEQACAKTKRPLVRVQMSRETDEDDLIGGFRLIEGETKFMKGPALRAMELGAVLLIDEADRADAGKIMCLQGILEGKPYYVKKTGEIVSPKKGFTIIVTANTKGKGSSDGRYVAASVLDDAWLERFPITLNQDFPKTAIETKILTGYLSVDREFTLQDKEFVDHLVAWSDIIRKAFHEEAIDEIISTRRLVHVVNTFILFGDRMRAINLCINRFDDETKSSFLELYAKVDPTVVAPTVVVSAETATAVSPDSSDKI